jgi:hypothetical protein
MPLGRHWFEQDSHCYFFMGQIKDATRLPPLSHSPLSSPHPKLAVVLGTIADDAPISSPHPTGNVLPCPSRCTGAKRGCHELPQVSVAGGGGEGGEEGFPKV